MQDSPRLFRALCCLGMFRHKVNTEGQRGNVRTCLWANEGQERRPLRYLVIGDAHINIKGYISPLEDEVLYRERERGRVVLERDLMVRKLVLPKISVLV